MIRSVPYSMTVRQFYRKIESPLFMERGLAAFMQGLDRGPVGGATAKQGDARHRENQAEVAIRFGAICARSVCGLGVLFDGVSLGQAAVTIRRKKEGQRVSSRHLFRMRCTGLMVILWGWP